jgi:hypothetical protein
VSTTKWAPRPPLVDGVREATTRDHVVAVRWMWRGFWHEWKKGPRRGYVTLLLLGWVVTAVPVLLPIALLRPHRSRARYYSNGQAILGVIVQRNPVPTWFLGDHIAARQARNYGLALRTALIPPLVAFCDTAGIHLEADTRSERMAHRYVAELPGATLTRASDGLYLIHRVPQRTDD